MTKSTITLGQILDGDIPDSATAVAWAQNETVETVDQLTDPSNRRTLEGDDYDRAEAGQLIFDEIPTGAVAWKFSDPTEDGRWLTGADDIAAIRAEDPSLVCVLADFEQ